LQFSRGISQITANFHAEEPVKVDGALYVGDVSHRNEAGYFVGGMEFNSGASHPYSLCSLRDSRGGCPYMT